MEAIDDFRREHEALLAEFRARPTLSLSPSDSELLQAALLSFADELEIWGGSTNVVQRLRKMAERQ